MPRAQDAAAYVYQGVWTDWSKGASKGLTVTLSQQNSAILVAALALFASAIGSQLWMIFRFFVHQYRATPVPKSALYHQQQVLLRNSGSSIGFLYSISLIYARWRKRSKRSFWSFIPLYLWALAHLTAFTALGLLSSKLVKVGDKVLIRSPYCIVNSFSPAYFSFLNQNQVLAVQSLLAADLQATVDYTRNCYNTTSPLRGACGTFATPNIKFNITTNVACPFNKNVCHPETTAVRFDTGYFDSTRDLGMNLRSRDRIYARKMLTCIPLNDAAYVKELPSLNQLNISNAFYGPLTSRSKNSAANSTYANVDVKSQMTVQQLSNTRLYDFAQVRGYAAADDPDNDAVGSFLPIPELLGTGRDLSLVFMTYAGFYQRPIDDPWFSAHVLLNGEFRTASQNETVKIYGKDTPISTLACNEQYQFCVTNTSTCTSIKGLREVLQETYEWYTTDDQGQSLSWILSAFNDATLTDIILQNGGNVPFLANDVVFGPYSPPLPSDQWRREAENWFSIGLALFQRKISHYSTGQSATDTSWINTTMTPAARKFCDNTVVRGTDYQSFSMLLIIILLAVGLLVVVLSYYIEGLAGSIQKRYGVGLARKQMWEANDLLQLQRLLYDALGEGTWSGQGGSVPVTNAGELLTALEIHLNDRHDKTSRDTPSPSSPYTIHHFANHERSNAEAKTGLISTTHAYNESDLFPSLSTQIPVSRRVKRKPLPSNSVVLSSSDWNYQRMPL